MFTVMVDRPGDTPVELTPLAESVQCTTSAVGGFGSCSFSVPGRHTRDLPYLGLVRVMCESQVVFEGRIENRVLRISSDSAATSVTCYGLQRLLTDTSVRKMWSKRNLEWILGRAGLGEDGGAFIAWPFNSGGHVHWDDNLDMTSGEIDSLDASKKGLRIRGKGVAIPYTEGAGAYARLPLGTLYLGVTLTSSMAAGWLHRVYGWTWGGGSPTVAINDCSAGDQILSFATAPNAFAIFLQNNSGGTLTPGVGEVADFTQIRALFRSTEDASGGYYGGTILRDLLTLVPGLTVGTIEDGSDFTIQAIERGVRDTALAVTNEAASYYSREWAVWENGRFDWRSVNLDEPQWTVTVADCDELEIEGSLDGLAKTAYVLYTDAASDVAAEASATATANGNPFVRTGAAKDDLNSPGIPMTANTSGQLATRIADQRGKYPPVSGHVVLQATKPIANAVGPTLPAACIRAGTNIIIPDLPKDELLVGGRDGQTLFHIASTELDMTNGTITLELEGQGRDIDVISARLAAVTRTLTG